MTRMAGDALRALGDRSGLRQRPRPAAAARACPVPTCCSRRRSTGRSSAISMTSATDLADEAAEIWGSLHRRAAARRRRRPSGLPAPQPDRHGPVLCRLPAARPSAQVKDGAEHRARRRSRSPSTARAWLRRRCARRFWRRSDWRRGSISPTSRATSCGPTANSYARTSYVFLTVSDAAAGRAWLGERLDQVTTAIDLPSERRPHDDVQPRVHEHRAGRARAARRR